MNICLFFAVPAAEEGVRQGVFWQEDLAVMVLPLQQMLHLVTLLLLLRLLCPSRELSRELTREPSPHHK